MITAGRVALLAPLPAAADTTISPATAYGLGIAGSPTLTGTDVPGVIRRIGGYPSPSLTVPATGERALANR